MVAGATTSVVMPQMGDSVTEGTILEWHKSEGDHVSADETLVEISTDKVDAEVPAGVAGTLVKIHAAAGDTVGVGALLAEIATNGDAPETAEAAVELPAASNGSDPAAPAEAAVVDIVTPAAGESVSEGTIPELLVAAGDTVTVGQVIGRMSASVLQASTTPAEPEAPADAPVPAGEPQTDGDTKASPVARRTAQVLDVDLGKLSGSGPAGRILQADVLAAAEGPVATSTATELRGGAGMLARYMEQSREIPTATSFRTIVVRALDARRGELKKAGARVSFTHLIAFAIARAAAELGVMADHFEEIDGKPHRIHDGAVNLGLAVDVTKKDGSRTLMVPVIRNAANLPFDQFLAAYDALVEKARTNTLVADDLAGANITLTNPGGIGTVASVPRLMPGQGTIVATG